MTEHGYSEKMAARRRELDEVNAALPELKFRGYGNGMPWQGEGRYLPVKRAWFYMRFRHNQASMTVFKGKPFESKEFLSTVVWPYYDEDSEEACGGQAGELNGVDEIVTMARKLVDGLAPVSEENPTSQMILMRQVEAMMRASKASGQNKTSRRTD